MKLPCSKSIFAIFFVAGSLLTGDSIVNGQVHASSIGKTGLPLPRFVSIKSQRVNMRVGPGKQYKEQFDSVKLIIRYAPELLFVQDKRGFTPLNYVPKDSWKDWRRFLERYRKLIRCKAQLITFQQSRANLQATLQKAQSAMSLLSSGKALPVS